MPPKHLRVKAEVCKDSKEVIKVTVLEVTFTGNFSAHGRSELGHHNGVYRYDDMLLIRLDSQRCAYSLSNEYMKDSSGRKYHYFLFGDSNYETTTIPRAIWPKLKAAVEDYNKWGATQ